MDEEEEEDSGRALVEKSCQPTASSQDVDDF